MTKTKRKLGSTHPIIWDFIKRIHVPPHIDRTEILFLYRSQPRCLIDTNCKELPGSGLLPDEKNYISKLIESARRIYVRDRNDLVVLQLLDTIPTLLLPGILAKHRWIALALLRIFQRRQYRVFIDFNNLVVGQGSPKSDENVLSYVNFVSLCWKIFTERLVGWIKENHATVFEEAFNECSNIADPSTAFFRTCLIKNIIKKGEEEGLLSEKIIRGLRRGVKKEAMERIRKTEGIAVENFNARIRRARKEPNVMALLQMHFMFSDMEMIGKYLDISI
jgi:hypothetical protein